MGMLIDGVVEGGSPTCRLTGKLVITLHGEFSSNATSDRHLFTGQDDPVLKGIVLAASTEARLDLHGALMFPTWTRLAAHVPGSALATGAPALRNTVLFLQDCVNWLGGQQIVVTTSQHKDTRGYNFNEERTIAPAGVKCLSYGGLSYGQLTLTAPLSHYHHAGAHEFQAEVALLSRHIVVRGNDKSEPTDRLESPDCDSSTYPSSDGDTVSFVIRFDTIPCSSAFLTGFGGHLLLGGEAHISGVEFWRMGQTNVLGRYPVHFHRNAFGDRSYVTDSAVHHSFYRAFVVHDTQGVTFSRNVAYDVDGHAFYLESGVEELNVLEYNLAAFVHCIDGCAIFHASHPDIVASPTRIIPADAAASGFYISNAHNRVSNNAASGGWAGFHFPVLPEPADADIRSRAVEPSKRPVLEFSGNSAHSTAWWTARAGAVYVGGGLFFTGSRDAGKGAWIPNLASSELRYSPGRLGNTTTDGKNYFPRHYQNMRFHNTTVSLVGGGVSSWNFASEWIGLEAHDPLNQPAFALGEVWFDNFAVNCRSSAMAHVPLPSSRAGKDLEHRYLLGEHLNTFRSYDHLTKHVLTTVRISTCGAGKPYFAPDDPSRQSFCVSEFGEESACTPHLNGDSGGIWNLHRSANHPEVNIISSGIVYADAGGVEALRTQPFFMGYMGHSGFGFGSYMQNWQDADGSLTGRGVPTVLGPSSVPGWWKLGNRASECDEFGLSWNYPMYACDQGDRSLANIQISAYPPVMPMKKDTLTGSMTHFGRAGDTGAGSTLSFAPDTTSAFANEQGKVNGSLPLGFQSDVVGAHNHAEYGGWYYYSAGGTPAHLKLDAFQIIAGSTLIMATSLPPGTLSSDIRVYAESFTSGTTYEHEYTQVSTLAEVRSHQGYDRWYHDAQHDTLYWRVIDVYIVTEGAAQLAWSVDHDKAKDGYERNGVFLPDRNGGRSINVLIACASTKGTQFCDTMPVLRVPQMGCPSGHEADSISSCRCVDSAACLLPPSTPQPAPTPPSPTPTTPAPAETGPATASPGSDSGSSSADCAVCTNAESAFMLSRGDTCGAIVTAARPNVCANNLNWVRDQVCQSSCFEVGQGYEGASCCPVGTASSGTPPPTTVGSSSASGSSLWTDSGSSSDSDSGSSSGSSLWTPPDPDPTAPVECREDEQCMAGCAAVEAPPPSCISTAGWTNGAGPDCALYEREGWCKNGAVREQWTTGQPWQFPEQNCCACGGGKTEIEGQSSCISTAGWTNGAGPDCGLYQHEGWCEDGQVVQQWTVGASFNYPEKNCCICGKE
jgi:hypothetical protein